MELRRVIADPMKMKNRRFCFDFLRDIPLTGQFFADGRFDSAQNLIRRSFVKSDRDSMDIAVEPDLFHLRVLLDEPSDARPGLRDFFHLLESVACSEFD